MSGIKTVSKRTRREAIVEALPNGTFGRAVLEKAIRETHVGERGITCDQSVGEYVGTLQDSGMVSREGQYYHVSTKARTPGKIVITIPSKLQIPRIIALIEQAVKGTAGITIDEMTDQEES